jgi:hypothetical protein
MVEEGLLRESVWAVLARTATTTQQQTLQADGDTPTQGLMTLDPDETYSLYQCLHELFHPV